MADDLAEVYADKKLASLEKRLHETYAQASKDIQGKLDTFLQGSAEREKKYLDRVKNGTMTQEQFDHWKSGQVFFGENWKAQQKSIAKVLSDTNKVATQMINDEKPDVFAFAGNYSGYKIEHGFGVDFGFDIYDATSVKRLLKDDPQILPMPGLNVPKDQRWNMQNIRSQITQGIIQGESIPKIAKRLYETVPMRNEKQATLHARTAMTSAHNGGRLQRMKEAEDLGIKLNKLWRANLDNRTRDAHQYLDGATAKPDEPFRYGVDEIMYPGDPNAEPYLVYNCRCKLEEDLVDYPAHFARRAKDENGKYYITDDTTYAEWYEQKTGKQIKQPPMNAKAGTQANVAPAPKRNDLPELAKLKGTLTAQEYAEFYDKLNQNEYVHTLYEKYGDNVGALYRESDGGYYQRSTHSIHYSLDKQGNPYATLAHEHGHAFDDMAKDEFPVHYSEIDMLNDRCKIGSGLRVTTFKRSPSTSDEYLAAARKDKEIIRAALNDTNVLLEIKNAGVLSSDVQDFADGLFATQDSKTHFLPWGHGNRYYNRIYNQRIKDFGNEKKLKEAFTELGFDASNQSKVKNLTRIYEASSELWANQVSVLTVNDDRLPWFERFTPNTMNVIKGLLKGVQ